MSASSPTAQDLPAPAVPRRTSEEAHRRALRRWRLVAAVHAFGLTLLFIGVHEGLADVQAARWLALYCAVGMVAFYAALRTGWSRRRPDPALTFPLALFNASAVALSYGISDLSRSASLQLLIVLVVFEMHRLNRRQTMVLTGGSAVILLLILGVMAWQQVPGFEFRTELYNIGLGGIMLPLLGFLARDIHQLRHRQNAQRTELAAALERLRERSMRDSLTGLYNRRQMLQVFDATAKRLARHPAPFCTAILDLDHFKKINDLFGHGVGDQVLKTFTTLAVHQLPTTDVLARWGGEEFVVLLHEADMQSARCRLDDLRRVVDEHDWSAIAPALQVTFSAGVARHREGEDLLATLDRADKALYAAKAEGRNRIMPSAGAQG